MKCREKRGRRGLWALHREGPGPCLRLPWPVSLPIDHRAHSADQLSSCTVQRRNGNDAIPFLVHAGMSGGVGVWEVEGSSPEMSSPAEEKEVWVRPGNPPPPHGRGTGQGSQHHQAKASPTLA